MSVVYAAMVLDEHGRLSLPRVCHAPCGISPNPGALRQLLPYRLARPAE